MDRIRRATQSRQEVLFEVPPDKTIKTEEQDPNQLDFNLEGNHED